MSFPKSHKIGPNARRGQEHGEVLDLHDTDSSREAILRRIAADGDSRSAFGLLCLSRSKPKLIDRDIEHIGRLTDEMDELTLAIDDATAREAR
ncbi:hypothetical protein [Halofilum ochraceum]|uniref:hypothetical protein n=1 Tax=Halofilum ochraceum TaxID=1611323 RepID=UPI0008DAF825|nr:hypothetical protein [Halofilum ochraceum]